MSPGHTVRARLRSSARARFGLVLLACIVLLGVFGDLLASPGPLLAVGPRGVEILPEVMNPEAFADRSASSVREDYRDAWTLWAPLTGPSQVADAGPAAPPSWDHPLGTDARGHDVLARLVLGARRAVGLSLAAVSIALALGLLMGTLAGYLGGWWEELLARPVELAQALPTVVAVAVVEAAYPSWSSWALVGAVALARWAEIARIVRTRVLQIANDDYIIAARALGCGPWRILRRHVVPKLLPSLAVSVLFGVASVTVVEVSIAFLGWGQGGSWGTMMAEGLTRATPPAVPLAAGAGLAATVLACHLIADALVDAQSHRVATTARDL